MESSSRRRILIVANRTAATPTPVGGCGCQAKRGRRLYLLAIAARRPALLDEVRRLGRRREYPRRPDGR